MLAQVRKTTWCRRRHSLLTANKVKTPLDKYSQTSKQTERGTSAAGAPCRSHELFLTPPSCRFTHGDGKHMALCACLPGSAGVTDITQSAGVGHESEPTRGALALDTNATHNTANRVTICRPSSHTGFTSGGGGGVVYIHGSATKAQGGFRAHRAGIRSQHHWQYQVCCVGHRGVASAPRRRHGHGCHG